MLGTISLIAIVSIVAVAAAMMLGAACDSSGPVADDFDPMDAADAGFRRHDAMPSGSDGGARNPDVVVHDEDGPRVLSVRTSTSQITFGEDFVVTFVVTDPDGIDDVIGGVLLDGESNAAYGSLASAAAEGAYGATVTWEAMQVVRSISFEHSDVRSFVAIFYDVAGHEVSVRFEIELYVEPPATHACDGEVVDVSENSQHCGACGFSCDEYCAGGACAPHRGTCAVPHEGQVDCRAACLDVEEGEWSCIQEPAAEAAFATFSDPLCRQFGSLVGYACGPTAVPRGVVVVVCLCARPAEQPEMGDRCTDGVDNDRDGYYDCGDSDCSAEAACV